MDRREFIAKQVRYAVAGLSVTGFSGCGTVFYSDRIGQPHSRDLDWRVVAMNGLGLILFFVPGVVAFAVDFYTGAIYLPEESHGDPGISLAPPANQMSEKSHFRKIPVTPERLNRQTIEQTVAAETGRKFVLDDTAARVSRLPKLNLFGQYCQRHHQGSTFGISSKSFFQQLRGNA